MELMCTCAVTYGVLPWIIRGLSSIACVLLWLALRCAAVGSSNWQIIVYVESLVMGCTFNQRVCEFQVSRPVLCRQMRPSAPKRIDLSVLGRKW